MQEMQPPWIAFPKKSPYDTFNQGMEEIYYNAWFYFWKELPQEQKEEYMIKWKASQEWRERLNSIDELINLDIEEDARESEEWFESIKHRETNNSCKKNIFLKIKSFFNFK